MAKKNPIYLGVNLDHVATLREARKTRYPDPLEAVFAAEKGGADGITLHLREDRRHIQERDVAMTQSVLLTRLNLEIAPTDFMIQYAQKIKPTFVCLVPEKREELTTEGGLDVIACHSHLSGIITDLNKHEIVVSIFIDPDIQQIEAAIKTGATHIEIHTGAYADAESISQRQEAFKRILTAAQFASEAGLVVNAGHGLNYQNVAPIAAIPCINELNIGHSIVAQAVITGLEKAVSQMKALITLSRTES